MQGASIGGGNILVNRINGMNVEFSGDVNTILIMHKDTPGVIASVTNLMHWEYESLNISGFHLSRDEKGGDAIMTIEIDSNPPDELINDIRQIEHITNAILIRRV
jgi:L-serine dehydratase